MLLMGTRSDAPGARRALIEIVIVSCRCSRVRPGGGGEGRDASATGVNGF